MANFTSGGIRRQLYASRFLDTVGDGTGSIDMCVDGSITPVHFKAICPPGVKLTGHNFGVYIEGLGTIESDAYGHDTIMNNGIQGFIQRAPENGGQYIPFFWQIPIKFNADWMTYCHDIVHFSFGLEEDALKVVYDFDRDGGGLELFPGDEGGLIINDDLTSLVRHTCRFGMTTSIHVREGGA